VTANDQLPAMTERIVRRFHPLQIILFGSQARGDAGQWSDIDLLVILPRVKDKWKKKYEIQGALREFRPSTDITVSTPDEIRRRGDMVGTVLRPALHEGKVLYQKEDGHVAKAEPVSEGDVQQEVAQWLVFADENMAVAELIIAEMGLARPAGYHGQQAAEMALKAVFVFLQIQYPLIHDLDKLRDALPAGWKVKNEFPNLGALSKWAVEDRYPGAQTERTAVDARCHVEQARGLLASVRRDLSEHGFTGDR
jgi:HEPN domain-containing protein/predicted nucleotidyltransferase